MSDGIPSTARAAVAPLLDRWQGFLGKVEGRIAEVEEESLAGLEELIGINPLDCGPISAGISAVQARFDGLRTKVEQAVEKLEGEWEEAVDELDLEGEALEAVCGLWDGLRRQEADFTHTLELRKERLLVRKQADWARLLQGLAREESGRERACPQCGAAFTPDVKHMASNVQCPFCNAINEVSPGSATGLFFQGAGVHHLASEKVFPLWEAMSAAERAYQRLRHPSEDDRRAYLEATEAYWLTYYRATLELNPAHPQTAEEATAARLLQIEAYDHGAEKKARARCQAILTLARAGDRSGLERALKGDPGADLDELVEAAVEHGERQGAALLLAIQHALEDVDEPRERWVQERLAELTRDLSRR